MSAMCMCPWCGATNVGPQLECLVCHRRLAAVHLIPAGGLPVWSAPDPTVSPVAHADEWQEVTVVEARGEWTLVRFSSGWIGWLAGSQLVPR
jgi:hypothetical protein